MRNQIIEEKLQGLRIIRRKKKKCIWNMIIIVKYLKEENGENSDSKIPPTARLPFMSQGKTKTL